MKAFVTGYSGQLGYDVVRELDRRGYESVGVSSKQLDICDRDAVLDMIKQVKPDVIFHCAAWTAVDAAEDEENRAKVQAINADGRINDNESSRQDIDFAMYQSLLV